MLHSSHSAVLNLYTITSSDLDENQLLLLLLCSVQRYHKQMGQRKNKIPNNSMHLLYKAAIHL